MIEAIDMIVIALAGAAWREVFEVIGAIVRAFEADANDLH